MWQYTPKTEEYWQGVAKNLGTPEPEAIVFDADKPVSDEQGRAMAEALNIHEQTGLTPAQLQARVAELEGALRELLNSTSMEELGEHTGLMDLLVTGDDIRAGFKALGVE